MGQPRSSGKLWKFKPCLPTRNMPPVLVALPAGRCVLAPCCVFLSKFLRVSGESRFVSDLKRNRQQHEINEHVAIRLAHASDTCEKGRLSPEIYELKKLTSEKLRLSPKVYEVKQLTTFEASGNARPSSKLYEMKEMTSFEVPENARTSTKTYGIKHLAIFEALENARPKEEPFESKTLPNDKKKEQAMKTSASCIVAGSVNVPLSPVTLNIETFNATTNGHDVPKCLKSTHVFD